MTGAAVLAVAVVAAQGPPPRALGLTVSAGGLLSASIATRSLGTVLRAPLEVAITAEVGDRLSVRAAGRVALPAPEVGWQVLAGIRSTFGDTFKTFFEADLSLLVNPSWTLGARAGFGIQYEVAPVVGLFAVAGIQAGGGPPGGLIGFELLVGAQFRTYILPW